MFNPDLILILVPLASVEIPVPVGLIVGGIATGGIALAAWGVTAYVSSRRDKEVRRIAAISENTCDLAAHLILADGYVDDDEIRAAIQMGTSMLPNFNSARLENACQMKFKLRSWEDLANGINRNSEIREREVILKYLFAIAGSDGDIDEREMKILGDLHRIWKLKSH